MADIDKNKITDWVIRKVKGFGDENGWRWYPLDERFELLLEVPEGWPDSFDTDDYEGVPLSLSIRARQNQYFENDNPMPYNDEGEVADDVIIGCIGEDLKEASVALDVEFLLKQYDYYNENDFENCNKEIVDMWAKMGVLPEGSTAGDNELVRKFLSKKFDESLQERNANGTNVSVSFSNGGYVISAGRDKDLSPNERERMVLEPKEMADLIDLFKDGELEKHVRKVLDFAESERNRGGRYGE